MFAATVTLLAIYLLTVLFHTGSICMCLARHLSGSSRAHRLWHWLERLSILGQLSYLVLRCCAVEIPRVAAKQYVELQGSQTDRDVHVPGGTLDESRVCYSASGEAGGQQDPPLKLKP